MRFTKLNLYKTYSNHLQRESKIFSKFFSNMVFPATKQYALPVPLNIFRSYRLKFSCSDSIKAKNRCIHSDTALKKCLIVAIIRVGSEWQSQLVFGGERLASCQKRRLPKMLGDWRANPLPHDLG